jgi:hypothetical protein
MATAWRHDCVLPVRQGLEGQRLVARQLKGPPLTYSWPVWSHDRTTARKIEAAKLGALTLAR